MRYVHIPPSIVADNTGDFNTGFHRNDELPPQEREKAVHRNHDLSLTYFGRHLPLILSSRHVSQMEVYTTNLPTSFLSMIQTVSTLAILTGRIPPDDIDGLLSSVERHSVFPPTVPQYGWFV